MEPTENQPCPSCATPTPVTALICAHCRQTLLVTLKRERPAEARAIYHASRAWAGLPTGAVPFEEARAALRRRSGVVATGLTRAAAGALQAVLGAHGIATVASSEALPPRPAGAAEPGGEVDPARARVWLVVGVAGGALALGLSVTLVLVLLRHGERPGAEPAREAASAEVAHPPLLAEHRVGQGAASPAATRRGPILTSREIAARAEAATVQVRCTSSEGSGFFVAPELVVTSEHVLCEGGAPPKVLLADGRALEAIVEHRDDWLDVAVLRVSGANAVPLPIGEVSVLQPGDRVWAAGNPRGLGFSISQGIVSHNGRNVMGLAYVQTDAAINPGNSGGPLIDEHGQVVGVVSMSVADSAGLGLALAIDYLYVGEGRVLAPPLDVELGGWKGMLAEAERANEREVEEARGHTGALGVAAAFQPERHTVIAIVLRRSSFRPAGERYPFRLRNQRAVICETEGVVASWQETSDGRHSKRYAAWAARNHLGSGLYSGPATIDLGGCTMSGEVKAGSTEVILAVPGARPGEAVLETHLP